MSELKKTEKKVKKYHADRILKSKAFSEYQQDFAKVVLGDKEYSIQEAKAVLDNFFKGGK